MQGVVVFITASSAEEGERIGRALLDERLAACVNSMPVRSAYWWRGAIEEAGEHLLIAKTVDHLVPRLADRVRALHSYEVPEVIALPILAGNPEYLDWIRETVRG